MNELNEKNAKEKKIEINNERLFKHIYILFGLQIILFCAIIGVNFKGVICCAPLILFSAIVTLWLGLIMLLDVKFITDICKSMKCLFGDKCALSSICRGKQQTASQCDCGKADDAGQPGDTDGKNSETKNC